MDRRLLLFVVVLLTGVLFVTAAVPAIGRDAVAPTLDRRGSAAALAKAKRALNVARMARGNAAAAQASASSAAAQATAARAAAVTAAGEAAGARGAVNEAANTAKAAKASAAEIQAELDASRIVSASEAGVVTSTALFGEYEALGGPAVEAVVPTSGLVEVWAQIEIKDENGGAVGLYEDGEKVTGISTEEICGDGSALIDVQGGGPGDFLTFSTPPTPSLPFGCANGGAPASVLLERAPGPHTYELRYSECSCNPGGGAEFRNRVLRVAPRP